MSPSTRCICVIVALSACSTTAVREQAHVTAGSSSISSPVKESTASAGVPTAASSPRTVTPTNSAAPFGPAQPATPSAQPATRAATATVAWSVVDGDTLDVQGPDGRVTVRLIGMNAPEKDECFAMQATAAMQQLLAGHTVTLVKDVSETDQYGRLLRFVETDAGVDVGAEMVRGGFAVSRRYPPDIARNSTYDELQTQAQAAGAGEWAANACGPASVGVSITITQHANAAGDDNKNLNDEWVRFTNQATAPIDLDRWIVADESSSHRYVFANFVLAGGASVTLHTGCGQDTAVDLYWCNTKSAVWNNGGDTVLLRDPSGNNVVVLKY